MAEEGFTGCGGHIYTDKTWLDKVRFMVEYQKAGKAYMASEYWNTSNPASSYVVMANATTVEYVLGSYLMGKQQASSMYATMQFEFKQLAAPVGHPVGSMQPVGADLAVYERNYSNARVLVNHRGPASQCPTCCHRCTSPLTAGQCRCTSLSL